jgi:hypothetical protein
MEGKLHGNWSSGRPGRRWKATMKMDLREIGYKGGRWMTLAQDSVQWWVLVIEVTNL